MGFFWAQITLSHSRSLACSLVNSLRCLLLAATGLIARPGVAGIWIANS